jgi:hypothetical protein
MARADAGHAIARSTAASLLAGNVLARRPGQVAARYYAQDTVFSVTGVDSGPRHHRKA